MGLAIYSIQCIKRIQSLLLMLENQLLNTVSGFEEDLNRLKRVDPVYTTCEAGKRRLVNRARSLASPSRAEAEAEVVAWRGVAW